MTKIVLGTVQFGTAYGVNNVSGRPTEELSRGILDYALSKGIRMFDTARAYGNSEEVLGRWIAESGIHEKVAIITKLRAGALEGGANIEERVFSECTDSLQRLNLESIDGYLLHAPEDLYQPDIRAALEKLKTEGLVRNIGVSVYDPKDALAAIDSGVDYIQVPYNALDQRLDQTDFLSERGKTG